MKRTRPDVIAVIQPFVPTYRKALFDSIDEQLRGHDLRLEVWHDFPRGRVAARGNADRGPWSVPIRQRRLSIGRRNITFRAVHADALRVRAVIAGLASTNLETYALAVDKRVNLMLWGHGRNFTASNNGLDGGIENWLVRRSSHVFTYTAEGKEHVTSRGLPEENVTVVVNTTDTESLRAAKSATSPEASRALRERFDLGASRIALFVGAFDEPKQLPFLIAAMDIVVREHPDVVLVMAGAGPDDAVVRHLAESRPHVRVIGRLEAPALAQFATITDLLVMPGRVGLVAVDALALGLPIATTDYPFHAPEARYLSDGVDSLWSAFDVEAYAQEVSRLFSHPAELSRLGSAAAAKGLDFSAEASARRFVDGILQGLHA